VLLKGGASPCAPTDFLFQPMERAFFGPRIAAVARGRGGRLASAIAAACWVYRVARRWWRPASWCATTIQARFRFEGDTGLRVKLAERNHNAQCASYAPSPRPRGRRLRSVRYNRIVAEEHRSGRRARENQLQRRADLIPTWSRR